MNEVIKYALSGMLLNTCGVYAQPDWHGPVDHSQLEFLVSYEGQQTVGVFDDFQINMKFDPQQPASGYLEVTVRVSSADMHSGDLNVELPKSEWFAASKFPESRFVSQSIKQTADGNFLAHGTLTLKGVEQAIDVPFSWKQGSAQAHMKGKLELLRTNFNIGDGDWASGDAISTTVGVRFDIQLQN